MPRIRLFGRRHNDGQPDLRRLADFTPPDQSGEQIESLPAPTPSASPIQLAQLRALSEEELFGAGGENVTYASVTGPRTPVPFVPPVRPSDSEPPALPAEESPPARSLRSVWDANIPFLPPPEAVAAPAEQAPQFAAPSLHAEPETADPTSLNSLEPAEPVDTPLPQPAAGKTLIGGDEADLVPLIPNTKPEAESAELDDETVAGATVEALHGACDVLVSRVTRLRSLTDGGKFISGMIALVADLDARYAEDWGVVRRNGLEELLNEVRSVLAEGDRFILESMESEHSGLTDQAFVRDLKTVGSKDRPRIVAEYTIFLVFVYRCVLLQYLRPLEGDARRLSEMTARLDYLIDGVREVLIQHVSSQIRG